MALFIDYPSWISPFVIPGVPIRWYSLMYIVAFAFAYVLFRYECKHDRVIKFSAAESQNLFFWGILGLLIGARLGSCFFYSDWRYYLTHPWMIFWPFQDGHFVGLPGMSYHGGLIGLILGVFIYTKVKKESFLLIADLLSAAIPLGYTFGRLGNFINAELYGRITSSPIGMLFPYAEPVSTSVESVRGVADALGYQYAVGDMINLPRFPSQLFEAFFEGIVLFLILWFVIRKLKIRRAWANGVVLGSYLIGYGTFRFFIEYLRQPDSDIGYILKWGGSEDVFVFESLLNISKGQIYCLMMVLAGIIIIIAVSCLRRHRLKTEREMAKTIKRGESDRRSTKKTKKGNAKRGH